MIRSSQSVHGYGNSRFQSSVTINLHQLVHLSVLDHRALVPDLTVQRPDLVAALLTAVVPHHAAPHHSAPSSVRRQVQPFGWK